MTDLDALRTGPLADVRDDAPLVEAATVFEGKVFDVNRETASFGGGTIVREYTTHHGAVAVLAIDEADRVLLINQYRQPVRTRLWEIPAGLLERRGGGPARGAKRELAEETDLVADVWSEPLAFLTSPGQSDEQVTLYEARALHPAPVRTTGRTRRPRSSSAGSRSTRRWRPRPPGGSAMPSCSSRCSEPMPVAADGSEPMPVAADGDPAHARRR